MDFEVSGVQMELIKKIKEAESQARQIIEHAKTQVTQQGEQNQQSRVEAFNSAGQQRKKAIDESIAKAQAGGLAEVEQLKEQADKDRHQLQENARSKMAGATEKVMEYLKG